MATKPPTKIAGADQAQAGADQAQADPATPAPAMGDRFPLSRRATLEHVMRAGIVNGMSAEECEERLAKVMS